MGLNRRLGGGQRTARPLRGGASEPAPWLLTCVNDAGAGLDRGILTRDLSPPRELRTRLPTLGSGRALTRLVRIAGIDEESDGYKRCR